MFYKVSKTLVLCWSQRIMGSGLPPPLGEHEVAVCREIARKSLYLLTLFRTFALRSPLSLDLPQLQTSTWRQKWILQEPSPPLALFILLGKFSENKVSTYRAVTYTQLSLQRTSEKLQGNGSFLLLLHLRDLDMAWYSCCRSVAFLCKVTLIWLTFIIIFPVQKKAITKTALS